jgi:hypothetical protein
MSYSAGQIGPARLSCLATAVLAQLFVLLCLGWSPPAVGPMQNRKHGPYLATMNRIFISEMRLLGQAPLAMPSLHGPPPQGCSCLYPGHQRVCLGPIAA